MERHAGEARLLCDAVGRRLIRIDNKVAACCLRDLRNCAVDLKVAKAARAPILGLAQG